MTTNHAQKTNHTFLPEPANRRHTEGLNLATMQCKAYPLYGEQHNLQPMFPHASWQDATEGTRAYKVAGAIKGRNAYQQTPQTSPKMVHEVSLGQEIQANLGSVGLGGGNTNLTARIDVDTAMRGASNGGADCVGHPNAERAPLLSILQCLHHAHISPCPCPLHIPAPEPCMHAHSSHATLLSILHSA